MDTHLDEVLAVPMALGSHLCLSIKELALLLFSDPHFFENCSYRLGLWAL